MKTIDINCRICSLRLASNLDNFDALNSKLVKHITEEHADKLQEFMKEILKAGHDDKKLVLAVNKFVTLDAFLKTMNETQDLASRLPSKDITPEEIEDMADKEEKEYLDNEANEKPIDDETDKIKSGVKAIENELGISFQDMLKLFSEFTESIGKHEEIVEEQFKEINSRMGRLEKIMFVWAQSNKLIAMKDSELLAMFQEWKKDSGL